MLPLKVAVTLLSFNAVQLIVRSSSESTFLEDEGEMLLIITFLYLTV